MKLKFRADKKDFVAFCWACLLLLFVVALCVVNFYHVAEEESARWTFNIIPAFFPPRLGYTIIFWILAIILIIASLSSYFFEREKGFGFKEGKSEKGFGRFAKESEYKEFKDVEPVELSAKESTAAGFPLLYDKKKNLVYVDNGEAHSLVIGATGTGKTQSIINPLVNILAKKGESMVITDPKSEIYDASADVLKSKGYNVIVVNFRDPQNGSCWNPYTLPYKYYNEGNKDKANELLNDMAINIATEEKTDDPFWTNSAADYLTGLSLAMFEDAPADAVNISTVNLMMTVGDEKIYGSTYLKEYFKGKDPASPAAINALGTINAPQETKNSVDAVLKQKIKVFAVTENLSEMLSRSDFDMEKIGEEKTAVFLIIQDEKTVYHALATIFIKQCYESLIAVAQRHGGPLPIRTNFLLDEFANMPKFKDITTMVTAARSRKIRMTMIVQNFAQLVQRYGKEDAETIRGNCGDILYLLTGELSALEEISKLCGDKIVKVGKDKKEETRPLITVTELQRFKQDEVLVLKHRLPPLKTNFLPFWDTDYGYGKGNKDAAKPELPHHEKQQIKLFDFREFVKKKKEESRNELFGGSNPFGGSSPFGASGGGNSFGPNPFMSNKENPFMGKDFNPFGTSSNDFPRTDFGGVSPKTTPGTQDDINIDDLVKKIDAKIAELENEEKAEKPVADEKDKDSSSNGNIDFSEFVPKAETSSKNENMLDLDDYLEDLSDDDSDGARKIEHDVKENNVPDDNKSINNISTSDSKTVYENKQEIDKIMNDKKKDGDVEDMFDDFFE